MIEREQEEWLRNLTLNESEFVVVLGDGSSIQYISRSVERVLGYRTDDLLGTIFSDLIHPEDHLDGAAGPSADGDDGWHTIRLRHRDGSWRLMEEVVNDTLESPGFRGLVLDGLGAEKPEGSELRFEDAFERAPTGMALVSIGGRLMRANRILCEIVGYTARELQARNLKDLAYPEDGDGENDSDLARQLLDGDIHAYRVEKHYLRKDGRPVWVSLDVSLVRGLRGNPPYFVVQIQDITRRKAFEEGLLDRASHVPLTGLVNKALFEENLEWALARSRRHGKTIAVFFLDLDDFKLVNDGLGHRLGDLLLIEVADRLKTLLRTEDSIAHLGGDKFAILLQDDTNADDLILLAKRILRKLREPYNLSGTGVRITASIGVVRDIAHEDKPEDLLQKAGVARYRAKSKGKDRHEAFEPEA